MSALTIAAIKGPCVGGGVVLAGVCDLRIAADDTVFSIPRGRPRDPARLGRYPPPGARDRSGVHQGTRGHLPPVRCRRGQGVADRQPRGATRRAGGPRSTAGRQLARKAPSVVRATKRQVNEALEDVASTVGAWADADLLGAAMRDPEARQGRPGLPRSPPTRDPARQAHLLGFWRAASPGGRVIQLSRRLGRRRFSQEVGGDVVEQPGRERERLMSMPRRCRGSVTRTRRRRIDGRRAGPRTPPHRLAVDPGIQ